MDAWTTAADPALPLIAVDRESFPAIATALGDRLGRLYAGNAVPGPYSPDAGAAGRRALRGRFYMVHYRPNELDTARLGVVVAKKLAKRANVRNLVKRIAPEIFRRQRTELPAMDLVVRLNAPVAKATRAELNLDLLSLLQRLPRQ